MAESSVGPPAVLLINHGSRQPHAAAFVEQLAATLRCDDPSRVVAVSFLELDGPTPDEALLRLAQDGSTEIQVVPLLFSAGHHYRIDVPAALDCLRVAHPDITLRSAAPLLADGDEHILGALDARLSEAIGADLSHPVTTPDSLVLLAAGSSDPLARLRVAEVADSWGRAHGLPTEVAFCDLMGDDVRAAIRLPQARGARRIVCGSLFLASGRLLDAGRRAALEAGAVAVAGPLGMTPALVDLIRRRCLEAVTAG